ncbi:MAG: molybdopterin adenylyltransferase, partial [Candidatus Thalassarchaeaceae archaeon]|nr:molybdopterin adenylyltransferase [Candidatus Thalassarchaeaceae archaeon]
MSVGETCNFGVLTASDRASSGEYEDLSGPAIEEFLSQALTSPWKICRRLVVDEQSTIEEALKSLSDNENCSVIITTGGTGPAPRDVTPEATEAVCDRMLPGFGEQMRAISLRHVPTAVLSRQTAGIRGSTLILNLPGSPRSIREILDEIFAAVPYCV